MPYTVTRQVQWPEGRHVVEVSMGGLDYTNPDALGAQFPGEFTTYADAREAAETAIRICEAWRAAGQPDADVGHGATGGMTMPFDTCSYEELRAWAQARFEKLAKCDGCGGLLPEGYYTSGELPEERFCSEVCADRALEAALAEDSSKREVCESCLEVAAEEGVPGRASQAELMTMWGADLPDHLCDAVEDPSVRCACGCRVPAGLEQGGR